MRRVEPALVAFATLAGIGLYFSKLCFHKTRVTSGISDFQTEDGTPPSCRAWVEPRI
jgi:hypothetical protein